MMRNRYLGWFALGVLISIAGAVVYGIVTRVCHEQETEAGPIAMAAESQPVA
jgi:hypothetical protein